MAMSGNAFLRNNITNQRYRINGYKKSSRQPRKANLRERFSDHVRLDDSQLPPKVDLRPFMTLVEDQSDIGSCVANSFAGAYEYLLMKATGRPVDVSRLFIYYNARLKDGSTEDDISDSGVAVASAIEALEESGTCLESVWPYDISEVDTRPNDEAYEQAENNKIIDALELNSDLYEMKACLAQGFPFVAGMYLFESFDRGSKKGVVPMPTPNEQARETDGGHAMLVVGYSDKRRTFIVRNSWGREWGDLGYCYIPYDYIANPKLCDELWAVRQLESDDMGHEHWQEDDEEDEDEGEEDENDEGEGSYIEYE